MSGLTCIFCNFIVKIHDLKFILFDVALLLLTGFLDCVSALFLCITVDTDEGEKYQYYLSSIYFFSSHVQILRFIFLLSWLTAGEKMALFFFFGKWARFGLHSGTGPKIYGQAPFGGPRTRAHRARNEAKENKQSFYWNYNFGLTENKRLRSHYFFIFFNF